MKKIFLFFLLFLIGCNGNNLTLKPKSINYVLDQSGDKINFATVSRSGLSISTSEIADGTITDADINSAAAIADTKLSFLDGNYSATHPGAAITELASVNGSGPNAGTGKVHWSELIGVPAGFADGADAVGAGPTLDSGAPVDISSSASATGSSSNASRADHTHLGLLSFNKNGGATLYGTITISAGAGITLVQSGQDITITAPGAATELIISELESNIYFANNDSKIYYANRNKEIDTIRDNSGINAGASSHYTVRGSTNYDIINDGSTATVVWNSFTATAAPTYFIIHTNETPGSGSITWDICRDGSTYQTSVAEDTLVTFTSTTGTSVKIRATIAGNASVQEVAVQVIP